LSAECAGEKEIKNWSITAEDMDKNNLPRFLLAHGVFVLHSGAIITSAEEVM